LSTYRGVRPATPVGATASSNTLLATAHPVPQVTTTGDAQHLVHVTGFGAALNPSPPAGTTQRAAANSLASILVTDRYQSKAGLSGAANVTSTLSVSTGSVTLALVPVTTTVRYSYAGHSDRSNLTTTTAGVAVDFTIPLVGNTAFTWSATQGYRFSHFNIHGDTITVTDMSGNRVWTGLTGPHGEQASAAVPTNTGITGTRLGWHGKDQRLTDRSIVHMGARPYSPAHGRFLAVDPIEGGCANDYTYVFGDPTNLSDLNGYGLLGDLWDKTGGKVVTAIKCDPIGSLGFATGVAALVLSGPVGWTTAGAIVGGVSVGLSAYGTARSIRSGDKAGAIFGVASLALGGIGGGLGKLAKKAGELAEPLKAFGLGASSSASAFDGASVKRSC
jgi:RHS repeat-associated protein